MKINDNKSDSSDTQEDSPPDNILSRIFDAVAERIYSLFGKTPAGHFLSFWVMNFMIYIVTLGAIYQFVPSDLEWINKLIFYGCMIAAFLASAYSTWTTKNKGEEYRIPLAIIDSLRVSVVGVIAMMVLYSIFFYYNPTIYVPRDEFTTTVSDLRNEFHTLDLNDLQINQILSLLREGNFVTRDELPEGLTEKQKSEVLGIINSSILSFATTLTAIPNTSCYLTLKDIAESVYVRDKADKTNGKIVDYLDINDVALVLGHDGNPNDGWWYIEITHRGKSNKGWIATKWVKLQDVENCSQMKQIATPFP